MVLSFLYLAFRALLGALIRSRRSFDVKDVELLVMRHELEILRRQGGGWRQVAVVGNSATRSDLPALKTVWVSFVRENWAWPLN